MKGATGIDNFDADEIRIVYAGQKGFMGQVGPKGFAGINLSYATGLAAGMLIGAAAGQTDGLSAGRSACIDSMT